ncbi:2,3,4,5-tetrahydropyridine-2,6-dicarboxylate N-acetyltransferase [Brochothrix campestris]|uniref:2,3,4,5-tetrahydropyridine-2,6-dicarboxylate N-acetyltransferase n=1 Tax=Brochothrix campestris FSL F6-1037 TaxID=1265861 RepID=W7CI86_9LIST|nr:2,3,4,5-tetrahydropyridine-2,6-dicarboxylate N-acetyltransferase [Brochothrix campestris]EUJ39099.1 2,3,4,5-tetrahydropyridine-2,6-carboxylate N-succinyltransferase [Brochothrix campestris FSL F6-1037]
MKQMDAHEIIKFIQESKKSTPVKVYLKGELAKINFPETIKDFVSETSGVIFGEWDVVEPFLAENTAYIKDYVLENDRRNSAIPEVDLKKFNARIEPDVMIRDQVEIGDNAVIMMGALINIGAVIGKNTMIDMNVTLGGRATVGDNCHIGAGTVLAGVVEPPSAQPVIVEDDVLIGANCTVLEGVRIGKGAVVAAGAVVIKDVAPGTVVAGVPAREIKKIDDQTRSKTEIMAALREL